MEHTCKLRSICQKIDKILEKFKVAEFKNAIHPSCCEKLMKTFADDKWEGPLLCGKFLSTKTRLLTLKKKAKGRVPWYNDGLTSQNRLHGSYD